MINIIAVMLEDYGIGGNLGFLNTDNASNNDTMAAELQLELAETDIVWDGKENRLQCVGHIINLAIQALLWAKNPHPDDGIDRNMPKKDDLHAWAKHGALGKLA